MVCFRPVLFNLLPERILHNFSPIPKTPIRNWRHKRRIRKRQQLLGSFRSHFFDQSKGGKKKPGESSKVEKSVVHKKIFESIGKKRNSKSAIYTLRTRRSAQRSFQF